MAEIKTNIYEKYQGTNVVTSLMAGHEKNGARVMRYQFSTGNTGATSVSWSVNKVYKYDGTSVGLKWYIGTDSKSHIGAVASNGYKYDGTVTISSGVASGSADIQLNPNTTYYLWIFPDTTTYGLWEFNKTEFLTLVVTGSGSGNSSGGGGYGGSTTSFTLSSTNVSIDNSITISLINAESGLEYGVHFLVGGVYVDYVYFNSASVTYTASSEKFSKYLQTSNSCTVDCYLATYINGVETGEYIQKQFTLNIGSGSAYAPTIGKITLTPIDANILVKGINGLTINVTGCNAATGSTIASYTISGPSCYKTIDSSSSSVSVSISSVTDVWSFTNGVATLTYIVTVTDSRGRSTSGTATIQCYDYYNPKVITFDAYRANENKEPDAKGLYIYCTYEIDYADVNGQNTNISVSIHCGENSKTITSTSKYGDALIDLSNNENAADTTYIIYAEIIDTIGRTGKSSEVTIFGSARILNITSDGTGVAFGKMAESNMFECVQDAKFYGDVECQANMSCDYITCNGKTDTEKGIASISCKSLACEELIYAPVIYSSQAYIEEYISCNTIASDNLHCQSLDFYYTEENGETKWRSIFDMIHPIGSTYSSFDITDPSNLFGGKWVQLEDPKEYGDYALYTWYRSE